MPPNRLIDEKSPYLLQHAHNPVQWFPWGDEAFARARSEDKPVFLSIGYSTCHWCHVMARESFARESTAAILNEHFVSIKVDREERPDVDRIYMTALQAMGQNGGWPMSMFLAPDGRPFYGGTYFPPEMREGRAAFNDVLLRVAAVWKSERKQIDDSAEAIGRFLQETAVARNDGTMPNATVLDRCFDQLEATFDATYGGFGRGPKFPRPASLAFLFHYHRRSGNPASLRMAEATLRAMAEGGIHDHPGGGFHRYAVDAEWRLPHFEKMLYDQAQLLDVYLDAWQITQEGLYADAARGICTYLLRDLCTSEGGFVSAEDADSLGLDGKEGEGAFYLWTKDEVMRWLGEGDGRLFCLAFGVEEEGNALFDPKQEFIGRNILYRAEDDETLCRLSTMDEDAVRASLRRSLALLLQVRAKRPRPHRDEKILASWNGMTIGALARAGAVLALPEFVAAARNAAEFVMQTLFDRQSGILRHRYCGGSAAINGQLSDYAFVVQGLCGLFAATQEFQWLEHAVTLADRMIALFADTEGGGFYETDGHDPSVIVRMKERYDGAEPAGNSVAALALLHLAALTGNDGYRTAAQRTIEASAASLEEQPVAVPNMATALEDLLRPPRQIVVCGRTENQDTRAMLEEVYQRYLPHAVLVVKDPGKPGKLSSSFDDYAMIDGKATVYVCENFVCRLPITEPAMLAALLDRMDE